MSPLTAALLGAVFAVLVVLLVHRQGTGREDSAALRREAATARALRDVAVAANEAGHPDDAIRRCLAIACRTGGWEAAHAFRVAAPGGELVPMGVWVGAEGARWRRFRRETEDLALDPGAGLPGRVLSSRRPEWMVELARPASFVREAGAVEAGIQAGVAVPALVGDEIVAVLEFYATTPRDPDPDFLAFAEAFGAILSRVLERERSREDLRRARDRFHEFFHHNPIPTAIARLDDGCFREANPEFLRLLGRSRDEVLGHTALELGAWLDPAERRAMVEALRSEGPLEAFDMRIGTHDGVRDLVATLQVLEVDGEPHILGSFVDVTERRRMEQSLRSLSHRLLEIQEMERARIARELHDEIGQVLTVVRLTLERAREMTEGREVQESILEGISSVDRTIEQVRGLAYGLRPPALDDLGLAAAVCAFAREQAMRAGIALQLDVPETLGPLPEDLELTAFRIVQEAVSNALRHAHPSKIELTVTRHNGTLEIVVTDDGGGFPPPVEQAGNGLGLLGMQERAELAGGRLEVESTAGRGTAVRARLPLADEAGPA